MDDSRSVNFNAASQVADVNLGPVAGSPVILIGVNKLRVRAIGPEAFGEDETDRPLVSSGQSCCSVGSELEVVHIDRETTVDL